MGLEAATIAYIAAGTALVGAGVSGYSAIEQGRASDRMARYNAAVSEQEANDKQRDAMIAAKTQREQSRKALARTRALYAKAGVTDTTGSPLLVQVEQAGELEKAAGAYEVAGVNDATRLRAQAALERMSGKAARTGGAMAGVGTLLSGVGQAGSLYYAGRKG